MQGVRSIVDKIIEVVCIAIMAIMTVLVAWQVFTRYVLNNPSATSEVITKYLFVWLILYGSAYVFGKREHMSILFIVDKFKPNGRRVIEIIGEIIVFVFAILVLVKGGWTATAGQMVQVDSTLQIPMGILYSALPISGVLILFYNICNIRDIIKRPIEQ